MSDLDPFAPIALAAADGARAEVLPYGAHVTAWRPAPGAPGGDAERLYLSARSAYRAGTAVRGGVPVCFPQFADAGPLPKHGFVRARPWALVRVGQDADGAGAAEFAVEDDAMTRAIWPHAFRCTVAVRVAGAALDVALAVENRGDAPFAFTGALHTYLAVCDAVYTHVLGLEQVAYRDKTVKPGGADRPPSGAALAPWGEVDRVYAGAPSAGVTVHDAGGRRHLHVSQDGWPDVVVWNPGEDAGAAIGDIAPGDWHRFLCVEAAAAASPVTVAAGATWAGRQRLEAR